ncbi:MAG: cytochrome oxidase assembly [Frankiales bacterium]|nr:cytochrome oxidase assembly [Frankiales bacterium]
MSPLLRASRRVSLPVLRRLTRASVVALSLIVATGGAVRLTRSGLGCDSWPDCGTADGWHALVEYGNRIAGALVGLVIAATLVGVYLLEERRPDLRRPALGLLAGFFGQAALGAVSVAMKLPPAIVVAHFLLSMVLVAVAALMHARTRPAAAAPTRAAPVRAELVWLSRALVSGTALILVLGTLVTGTGPHSGANPTQPAPRFTFLPLPTISMVHGNLAVLVVGLAVANLLVIRMTDSARDLRPTAQLVVAALVLQAAIGISQYALGLPRGLVELHMIGATLVWLATLGHHLALRRPADVPSGRSRGAGLAAHT